MKKPLNNWEIFSDNIGPLKGQVPCSVLSILLDHKIIPHPYYEDNEKKVQKYLEDDYTFKSSFSLSKEELNNFNYLCFDCLDTIASIYINGNHVFDRKNFHLSQKIELDSKILKENNIIEIKFESNYKYINKYDDKGLFKTYSETNPKSIVMRKPNYMFGWDWAPDLPDTGILGEIYILSTKEGYLESLRYEYEFLNDKQLRLDLDIDYVLHNGSQIEVSLLFDDKVLFKKTNDLRDKNSYSIIVDDYKLWYHNGYGEQPLYELVIKTNENTYSYKIGFKDVKFNFDRTDSGRDFSIIINGVKVFLQGFDYVPEDSILTLVNNERTNKTLELIKDCNANVIRIWGGGYYPSDYLLQRCDELGILVWQDLMFADAAYNYEDREFMSLVRDEIAYQVKRIRNHPSLLLICGNNENESAINGHEEILKEHFIKMFCEEVPNIIKNLTNTQYLHSSPTNLDPLFNRPNDPNTFDVHYWEVGNGNEPYEKYGEIFPPMLSEFGLWSLPTIDTLRKYVGNELEAHNKRDGNFERINNALEVEFKPYKNIEEYIYLSQLYQARGVRYCFEHLRNNMTRCHGGIYWQFNDCWPVISCSVLDYDFIPKPAYYYLKRVFNNELIIISEKDDVITIKISNLLNEKKNYVLCYEHLNFDNKIINKKEIKLSVNKTSTTFVIRFDSPLKNNDELLVATLKDEEGHEVSRSFYQKNKDRYIDYPKAAPTITKIGEKTYKITANTFIKDLYLYAKETIFSDNCFTLLKDEEIIVTTNKDINVNDIKILNINNI